MSPSVPRLFLLIPLCAMASAFVSCETEPVGPDGNIFLRRSPRYGHGGTEGPRYKYGATGDERAEPGTRPRRETRYLSDREDRRRREEDRNSQDDGESNSSGSDTENEPPSSDNENTRSSDTEASGDPPADTRPKPKSSSEDLPYATPVPGKDGFVYSPYYSAGYVDVSGMPSGSKARCPYTKKIFRVP
jgi:hypothetical protein